MRIFDRIRLQDIDRRDWQLWVLALAMLLILAGGTAVAFYPLAADQHLTWGLLQVQRSFIGFCVLSLLFIGYLVDRLLVIKKLRKELSEERKRNLELRGQAGTEVLRALPGVEEFRDRLALEVQRSENSEQPLSALTVGIEASPELRDAEEIMRTFGEAVKSMMPRLRGEDSIFQFGPGAYGILLPGAEEDDAERVAERVGKSLSDAAGASKRYSYGVRVTSYPDGAKSVEEMERLTLPALLDALKKIH